MTIKTTKIQNINVKKKIVAGLISIKRMVLFTSKDRNENVGRLTVISIRIMYAEKRASCANTIFYDRNSLYVIVYTRILELMARINCDIVGVAGKRIRN